MCVGAHRGQERVQGPLELELQVVMGTPMWMLGTMLGYSEEL